MMFELNRVQFEWMDGWMRNLNTISRHTTSASSAHSGESNIFDCVDVYSLAEEEWTLNTDCDDPDE